MSRLLIIGYGNTLRDDDGAGRHVAERVAQALGREAQFAMEQSDGRQLRGAPASGWLVSASRRNELLIPKIRVATGWFSKGSQCPQVRPGEAPGPGQPEAGAPQSSHSCAAGSEFAESSAQGYGPFRIDILSLPQLTPEVALDIAQAEEVYFIDASEQGEPGRWTCQTLLPLEEKTGPFAHQCNPATLLGVARALYQASPRAWLITIPGKSFQYGETLSPEVESAVGEITGFLFVAAACDRR